MRGGGRKGGATTRVDKPPIRGEVYSGSALRQRMVFQQDVIARPGPVEGRSGFCFWERPMRYLGVDISAKQISWIILETSNGDKSVVLLPKNKLGLPKKYEDELDNMLELRNLIYNTIREYEIDKVSIVKATESSSIMRAKIEVMAQLASKDADVPCRLVHPQTIVFAKKGQGFAKELDSIEDVYFGGHDIKPKYLEKAAYAAWAVSND